MGAEKSIFFLFFCPHFSAKNSSSFEAAEAVNSAVPTRRRMNGAEMFMRTKCSCHARPLYWNSVVGSHVRTKAGEFRSHAVEEKVNDRRRAKGEHLTHEQATHDGDAERFAK